jgi:GH35 family endo-1,4-beta-xylanase
VGDARGPISAWDAINETVIMPVFANGDNAITPLAAERGVQEVIALAFEEARAADPDALLLINDFDLSPDYERVIEAALGAGVPIGAIGLQTHMHQGFRGAEQLLAIADRFARFGLPLHFTETTLLSGDLMPPEIVDLNDYVVPSWPSTEEGEARQADELEVHYRTLVSHPAVESITYWGFTDAGAWLNAPVGMVRADGSRKPSFDRLRSLIKGEWWMPPTAARTDGDGTVVVDGFRGEYTVSAGGSEARFALRGDEPLSVALG